MRRKTNSKISLATERELSIFQRLVYGFGSSPSATTSNCTAFFSIIFLLETCNITPEQFTIIQVSGRVWDAVTDPLIGYLVSRTKTSIGQIRPWLIFATPFGAASFLALFYCIGNLSGSFYYYFVMVLLFQLFLTMYHVPYTSYVMRITSSRRERDTLSAYRIGNDCVSMLIGLAIFGYIISLKRLLNTCEERTAVNLTEHLLKPRFTQQEIEDERFYYLMAAGVLSLWYLVSGWVCAFFLSERNDDELIRSTISFDRNNANCMDQFKIKHSAKINYFAKVKTILAYKPYFLLMIAFLTSSLGLQVIQNALVIYVSYSIKLPKHAQYVLMTLLLVSTLSIPAAHKLSLVFGKRRVYIVGTVLLIPATIASICMPEKPNLWLFYGLWVYAGFSFGITYLLPWSMLPDVIHSFQRTNKESTLIEESVFYSFYVFFTKFAVGFSSTVMGILLKTAGYNISNPCDQPKEVGDYVRYVINPFSILAFVISIVILYFYPLDERKLAADDDNEIDITEIKGEKDSLKEFQGGTNSASGVASAPPIRKGSITVQRQLSSLSMRLSTDELGAWDAAITGHSGMTPSPYLEKQIQGLRSVWRHRTVSECDAPRPRLMGHPNFQRSVSRGDNPLAVENQMRLAMTAASKEVVLAEQDEPSTDDDVRKSEPTNLHV